MINKIKNNWQQTIFCRYLLLGDISVKAAHMLSLPKVMYCTQKKKRKDDWHFFFTSLNCKLTQRDNAMSTEGYINFYFDN